MTRKCKVESLKKNTMKIPTPALIQEAQDLGGLGMTLEMIRCYFGVDQKRWTEWGEEYPELKIAMKRGRSITMKKVVGKLMEQIEKGKLSAIIFYLKTQGQWRETGYMPDEFGEHAAMPIINVTGLDPNIAARVYRQVILGVTV